ADGFGLKERGPSRSPWIDPQKLGPPLPCRGLGAYVDLPILCRKPLKRVKHGSSEGRSAHTNPFEFNCLRVGSRGPRRPHRACAGCGLLVLVVGVPVALDRRQERGLVVRRPTGSRLAVD